MAALAGYQCQVILTGNPVSVTGEAASNTSGKVYQITDSARQFMDPDSAITWKDNGVAVAAANIESVDVLFGEVTFAASYTVTGPVTCDYSYLPTTAIADVQSFSFSTSRDMMDKTGMSLTTSHRTKVPGLYDASGSIDLLDTTDTTVDTGVELADEFTNAAKLALEFRPNSTAGQQKLRAYIQLEGLDLDTSTEDLVRDSVSYGVTNHSHLVNTSLKARTNFSWSADNT